MADPAAINHPEFARMPIAKNGRISRLYGTVAFAAACLFTFAIDQSAIAQPEGVLGYEAIDVGGSADWLDEFARVVDRRAQESNGAAIWINGKRYLLDAPTGFDRAPAYDISPTTGIVVGNAEGDHADQPIVWHVGGEILLDNLVGTCNPTGINDSNRVVGFCALPARAALWNRSRTPIDLGDLGGGSACALAINQRGEIVGWSERPGDSGNYPVLWKPNGEIVDLFKNVTGEARNYLSARSLNNVGEIVGGNWYLRDGNLIATGNMPGGCGCAWQAINDRSLFVGYCNIDSSCLPKSRRAFVTEVLSNWQMRRHNINDFLYHQSDFTLLVADDINNAGQIAAFGELPGGEERGFLVTPYQFEASEPAPGVAGERNTITVTNLELNQRVILVFGTKEGAQPVGNGCLGGLVLIRDASTHQSLETFADNSGVATFNVFVPKSTADKTVRYQVIAPDECEISHTVEFTF